MFLFGNYKSVQELKGKIKIDEKRLLDMAKEIPIWIVDDDPQGSLDEVLRKGGYTNVRRDRNISHIEDVEKYQIILMDIHGIGGELGLGKKDLPFEGLSVAEEIKRKYPFKKVLVFSAGIKKYEHNYILRTVVDDSFVKDLALAERNGKIDKCIRQCYDPSLVWIDFRKHLIEDDVPINEIARMEDYYVRSILGKESISEERTKRILNGAKVTVAVISEFVNIVSSIVSLL